MFDPGGAGEADHIHLIQASFGDVIANGVGLARVGDTAGAALTLWEHTELTFHLRARQRPAVHFPLLEGKQRCQGRGRDGREAWEEAGGGSRCLLPTGDLPTFILRPSGPCISQSG